jgi:hypothetical protein
MPSSGIDRCDHVELAVAADLPSVFHHHNVNAIELPRQCAYDEVVLLTQMDDVSTRFHDQPLPQLT